MTYYANMVPPQAEFRIERKLRCSGYDAKVYKEQRFIRSRGHKRKAKVKEYPLMKGYMVLRSDQPLDPQVMDHYKLKAVHGAGSWYGTISRDEVQQLQNIGDVQSALPNTTISRVVGELVLIKDGPFNGHGGKITAIENGKAWVDVQIFARPTPVEIALDALEAA